jgi:integrase
MRVVKRAGIVEHVRIAQHLLGHVSLGTTDTYLGRPRLDDMVAAGNDATYALRTNVLGAAQMPR